MEKKERIALKATVTVKEVILFYISMLKLFVRPQYHKVTLTVRDALNSALA